MRASDLHSSILASDTALSLTSKGKPLLPRSLSRSWKRVSSIRRLSGLTLSPSEAETGAARWIASLPDSPVSHTALRESGQDSKTSDGSGPTLPGLLATLDRSSSSWRTSQVSLLPEVSTRASPILPRSGTTRSGRAYLRPPLALRTNGSGCSSSLGWPTPDCHAMERTNQSPSEGAAIRPTLALASKQWATPNAHDGRRPGVDDKSTQGGNLNRDAAQWPTPAARDFKGANSAEHATVTGGGRKHMDQLANFVEHSPQAQAIQPGPQSSSNSPGSRRRLNPAFACWLMGWLWFWTNPAVTSSAQSAMASWRSRQRALMCDLLDEPGASVTERVA